VNIFTNSRQEMIAEMEILYPEFDPTASNFAADFDAKNLTTCGTKDGIICCPVPGQNWGYAQGFTVVDGTRYFKSFGSLHVGAKSCNRIPYSYNSAIYWCNDVDLPNNLPPFF
jgi:hypothetical protein